MPKIAFVGLCLALHWEGRIRNCITNIICQVPLLLTSRTSTLDFCFLFFHIFFLFLFVFVAFPLYLFDLGFPTILSSHLSNTLISLRAWFCKWLKSTFTRKGFFSFFFFVVVVCYS